MRSFPAKIEGHIADLAVGCQRLVNQSVSDAEKRLMLGRLVVVLLVGPFIVAPLSAFLLSGLLARAEVLAVLCMGFALSWMAAASVAASGRARIVAPLALIGSAVWAAAMIILAGGLASPITLLLLALPAEAFWVSRHLSALRYGTAAAAASLVMVATVALIYPQAGQFGAISAAYWLVPLLWLASCALRFRPRAAEREPVAAPEAKATSLEAILPAVILRLDEFGQVHAISGQLHSMFGLPAGELHGNGFRDRIHVGDKVAYLSALADIRRGAPVGELQLRLRLPDSSEDQLQDRFRPFALEMLKSDDDSCDVVLVVRDDSERAGLRDQLSAIELSAEKHDVAMRRFLGTVSHELRTPLNSIIGFSDMLLHDVYGSLEDNRQRECVELIAQSGNHLLSVVNSILDVSKIESGTYAIQPEPFVFRDAVVSSLSMMSPQSDKKRIVLDERIPGDVGEINADRRAVQQILINLVSNAVKFTPEGGTITVDAQRLDDRLQFQISDTGIGMSKDDLEKIGRPFTQVQNDYTRQYEGTGLGLSLVKGLVALHEGEMSIESAPEMGTTVTVRLPIAGPARPAAPSTGEPIELTNRMEKEGSDETFQKTA